jgi:hypothetical protein
MGDVLKEEVVKGPIEGLRGIPPEVYARTRPVASGKWQVFQTHTFVRDRTAVSLAITPKRSVITPK